MILILLLHCLILWTLEFYPYPELFIYPYLTAHGFLPYLQIMDQHFPGLMFFPINFYTLGFTTPMALKLLLIAVVATQSLWIFKISKSKLTVFAYALWQPFFEGNQLWLDTFLGLFTLPAFALARAKKWFWVGLILGVGVVFKQTLVPLVAFVGLTILWQRDFKGLFRFSIAALFPSALMLLYFQHAGVAKSFIFWAIQFNLGAYAAGGKLAPTVGQLARLTLPVAVIGYVFFKNKSQRLTIGWLVFSIIGGIARFGFIHLQPAIPFFALIMPTLTRNKKILVLYFVLTAVWLGHFYSQQRNFFAMHFFDPQTLSIIKTIKDKTDPGDKIFLLGLDPHIYAVTQTLPPGQEFIFQFPWFLRLAQNRILGGLIVDPPKIVLYNPESNMDGQFITSYGSDLIQYTQSHYQLTTLVGGVLLYENRH